MLTPEPPARRAAPAGGPAEYPTYTPAEVARLFGVSHKTLTKWADAGKLSSFRTLGGHRRFYAAEVDELITPSDPAPRPPATATDPRP